MLCTEIKIAYLVSRLIITRIVSNLENDRSFSIKSIKIKFQRCLEIKSYSRDL